MSNVAEDPKIDVWDWILFRKQIFGLKHSNLNALFGILKSYIIRFSCHKKKLLYNKSRPRYGLESGTSSES
jgi:hypothetical protein